MSDPHKPADVTAENDVESAIERYLALHGQLANGEVLTGHIVITRVTSYHNGRPVTTYGLIPSSDLDTAGQLGMLQIAETRVQRNIDH